MKLYLVKRTDHIDYDETDSMVIVAKDEADARRFASESREWNWRYDDSKIIVERIFLRGKQPQLVLFSFNAG